MIITYLALFGDPFTINTFQEFSNVWMYLGWCAFLNCFVILYYVSAVVEMGYLFASGSYVLSCHLFIFSSSQDTKKKRKLCECLKKAVIKVERTRC